MMKAWTLLVASTFVTLFVVGRWTLSIKRGAGPQGGEILFLCWLALFFWAVLISVISAAAHTKAGSGVLRSAAFPLTVAVATTFYCVAIAWFINNASLSHITETQSRLQNWCAFFLYAALISANLWFLTRR
jgi:hypothetical protein